MFAGFFIDRPIFASVLSIVITLAGGIAVWQLPIAQYPQITPPTVQLDCNYPGANADTVAESIAAPIEQQVNGVENMLYMSSACTNDGSYTLTVTFRLGVDLDVANVLVQNRANLALPTLPDVVKQTGVSIRKRSPDILLVGSMFSPDGSRDQLFVSNYAVINMREELARLPGISECFVFGVRDYSMRVWLDPEKMSVRGLNAGDVVNALSEQNVAVAVGSLAQPPVALSQMTQFVVTTTGRLSTTEEFADVVVKRGPLGQVVRIKDLVRDKDGVTLAARNEDISNRFGTNKDHDGKPLLDKDGKHTYQTSPAVGLAIFQLPDANALETADLVKDKIEELRKDFPPGIDCQIGYDTTPFIRESIDEVANSLRDAIILVAVVVLVFLQSWRSAIIPLVAVPVAIIGTFAVMLAAGFSLNNLTLFGLVLAIGIVVDDAIVVVETVEHHIEHGLAPREAAMKAMHEVSGPVIAVGLVLSAVFIPCAFISGIIGQFFRQFALTIAISTLISAFNSLTLSPALAAILLRPKKVGERDWGTLALFALLGVIAAPVLYHVYGVGHGATEYLTDRGYGHNLALGIYYSVTVPVGVVAALLTYVGFNPAFSLLTRTQVFIVGKTFRVALLVLVVYGGLLGLTWWGFTQLPRGFIPTQDKGYAIASIQLPDAASAVRTAEAIKKIEKIVLTTDGVSYTTSIAGNSFVLSAYGPNFGSMFIILEPFDVRNEKSKRYRKEAEVRDPEDDELSPEEQQRAQQERREKVNMSGEAIMGRMAQRLAEVTEADVAMFGPPPVSGLGRAGGFRVMIEDRGDAGAKELEKETVNMVDKMRQLRLGVLPRGGAQRGKPEEAELKDVESAVNDLKSGAEPQKKATKLLQEVATLRLQAPPKGAEPEEQKRWVYFTQTVQPAARMALDDEDGARKVKRPQPKDATVKDVQGAARDLKATGGRYRRAAKWLGEVEKFFEAAEESALEKEDETAAAAARELKDAAHEALAPTRQTGQEVAAGDKRPVAFTGAFTVYRADAPQLFIDVDRKGCMQMGVELADVFNTLQTYLGSRYVNDFNLYGRTWQVVVQADAPSRNTVEDVKRLKVRNRRGQMVPLGSIAEVRDHTGPLVLTRYNTYPAAGINGSTIDGLSSGDARAMVEALAEQELPHNMKAEWTEIFYLEQVSGNTGMIVFAFSVVFVFLVLAAQYESWTLPMAVILVVPMCVLSSLVGVYLAGHDVNVFTQVGFIVLIGLACKNAILIVEFAKLEREKGKSAREVALEACRLRLRPILMTSFAFIFGVVPLILAHGAGAEMRQVLGTAVFAGMLGVTVFGVFLTPVFFLVIDHVMHFRVFTSPGALLVNRVSIWTVRLLVVAVVAAAFAAALARYRGWL